MERVSSTRLETKIYDDEIVLYTHYIPEENYDQFYYSEKLLNYLKSVINAEIKKFKLDACYKKLSQRNSFITTINVFNYKNNTQCKMTKIKASIYVPNKN